MKKKTPTLSLGKPFTELKDSDKNVPKDTTNLVSRMAAANELAKDPEAVKEIRKYGKIPVIYGPTKSMVRKPAEPGLKNFICQATTVDEVNNLLERGKTQYKNASSGTVRKWEKAAIKRIAQLSKS